MINNDGKDHKKKTIKINFLSSPTPPPVPKHNTITLIDERSEIRISCKPSRLGPAGQNSRGFRQNSVSLLGNALAYVVSSGSWRITIIPTVGRQINVRKGEARQPLFCLVLLPPRNYLVVVESRGPARPSAASINVSTCGPPRTRPVGQFVHRGPRPRGCCNRAFREPGAAGRSAPSGMWMQMPPNGAECTVRNYVVNLRRIRQKVFFLRNTVDLQFL